MQKLIKLNQEREKEQHILGKKNTQSVFKRNYHRSPVHKQNKLLISCSHWCIYILHLFLPYSFLYIYDFVIVPNYRVKIANLESGRRHGC